MPNRPDSIVRRARQVALAVTLVALVSGAATVVVYRHASNLTTAAWDEASEVSATLIETSVLLRAWEGDVSQRFAEMRAVGSGPDDQDVVVASYRVILAGRAERVDSALGRLADLAPADTKALVERIEDSWSAARGAAGVLAEDRDVVRDALSDVLVHLEEMSRAVEELSRATVEHYEDELADVARTRTVLIGVLMGLFLVTAAGASLTVRRLAARLSGVLATLAGGAERFAQSDLSHRIAPSGDVEFDELAGRFNDMAERLGRTQSQLEARARTDELTGLPNRRALLQRLAEARRGCGDGPGDTVFALLDLDGFKEINDSRGHPSGDQVLVELAGRLLRTARPGDHVARLGGDEFGFLFCEVPDRPSAEAALRGVLAEVARPVRLEDGAEVSVRGSAGLVRVERGRDPDDLLRDADVAMYAAKADPEVTSCWFEQRMQTEVAQRASLQSELRRAVEADQFVLHFQPIVDTSRARVVSVECLVRWQHPESGLLGPDRFIPLAESSGLIEPLGDLILARALHAVPELDRLGGPPRSVSVNLSPRQLANPHVAQRVRSALEHSGADPSRLVLEVTESVWLDDVDEAVGRLGQLKALGVWLSLDDFGTGYSSLSYLGRLPVDHVKLDKTLAQPALSDERAAALVAAVLQFSDVAGLTVVAEGVETRRQERALSALGCSHHQGYLFARPVPLDRLADTIRAVETAERELVASQA